MDLSHQAKAFSHQNWDTERGLAGGMRGDDQQDLLSQIVRSWEHEVFWGSGRRLKSMGPSFSLFKSKTLSGLEPLRSENED